MIIFRIATKLETLEKKFDLKMINWSQKFSFISKINTKISQRYLVLKNCEEIIKF